MIATATLVGTLITAIVRTIKQINPGDARVYNETAHTIAVVCILFVTILQVWFGARIGTFTTDAGAIHILENMREGLDSLDMPDGQIHPHFPPLQLAVCRRHGIWTWISKLVPERIAIFFPHCPLEHAECQTESHILPIEPKWRRNNGNFMGINSSWRGCNKMTLDSGAPSHVQLFVISFLFAICGAGLPAYFLSASNNSVKTKLGIGCRSLSWIGIMTCWILSFALDSIFRGWVCQSFASQAPVNKLRKLWRLSIAKDAFATSVVITLVLLVQVGTYNSCWCRASFRGIVNMMGYTPPEWERAKLLWCTLPLGGLAVNLGLILWVEFTYWEIGGRWGWVPRFSTIQGGTLLCKNEKDMEEEWKILRDSAEETNDNDEGGVELRLLPSGPSISDDEQLQHLLVPSRPNISDDELDAAA